MSIHNMDCWSQKEYLGFGVAAASFMNNKRFSNTNSIDTYIENINSGKFLKNRNIDEILNNDDLAKEYIILGLRKVMGFSILEFIRKFGTNPLFTYDKEFNELLKQNLLEIDYNNYTVRLSKKGLDFANIVWEQFV